MRSLVMRVRSTRTEPPDTSRATMRVSISPISRFWVALMPAASDGVGMSISAARTMRVILLCSLISGIRY